MEFGEDFEDCAEREVREETALKFSDLEFLTVTNDIFTEKNTHYTTNFFVAKLDGDRKDPLVSLKPGRLYTLGLDTNNPIFHSSWRKINVLDGSGSPGEKSRSIIRHLMQLRRTRKINLRGRNCSSLC